MKERVNGMEWDGMGEGDGGREEGRATEKVGAPLLLLLVFFLLPMAPSGGGISCTGRPSSTHWPSRLLIKKYRKLLQRNKQGRNNSTPLSGGNDAMYYFDFSDVF